MTLFFILAAVLVVVCLGWLLLGLFRSKHLDTNQEAVNITLARERRETLDNALASGAIDQQTYDYEREQLEYDLAADLKLDTRPSSDKQGHVPAAILVAMFIPLASGALYLHLGSPAAISKDRSAPAATNNESTTAPSLTELLPELEQRLAQSPDDVEGWRLLGRSYLTVSEFPKARKAFEKALALDENDAPTLAQLAESIAMTQDGNLAGEPIQYLERAQAVDADNEHSLWLLSIARQQAGDHETALAGFNKLAGLAQQNPEALATIEQMRRESMEALSIASTREADSGVSVSVSVSLSDAASTAVESGHSVFVYAKATEGPPMPLAVSRLTVADLPTTVVLDESMAMIPGMSLSAFPQVTIGARVSASGNAIAQSGDWYSESGNVSPGEEASLEIIIDQQTP